MQFGELKPLLAALALPPTLPLLLLFAGLVLAARRQRWLGLGLSTVAAAGLWLLSCSGFALLIGQAMLPATQPVERVSLDGVQAIVVLGAGVVREAPEYGAAQPNAYLLARLRYAARLARETGKPLAFSGGIGWASVNGGIAPEGEVAARTLAQDFRTPARWVDADSRDTHENALRTHDLLARDGIHRIALVTHSWHMPRAVREFERAGFEVVPAPTGFPAPQVRPLLQWIPSGEGLADARVVLREVLGLLVQR